MIDTIQFELREGQYHIPDPAVFRPSFDVLTSRSPQLIGVSLYPKIEIKSKSYYPQVYAYCYTREKGQRSFNIKVKCSVPKFMKGDNLFSLRQDILNGFCLKMARVLDDMGVQITPEDIAKAKVCTVDIAHNMLLPVPVYIVLADLEKAFVPTDMDISKSSFKNGGLELQHYYKSWELAFYDKAKDMQHLIKKAKQPIDVKDFSQAKISKACEGKHILRMELRLKEAAYLNKIIGKQYVSIQDIFNDDLVKNILINKWQEIEENILAIPGYKKSAEKYLADIRQKNPKLSFDFISKRLPTIMMLAESGVRATRNYLMAFGNTKTKTERMIREAKKIKLSKYMPSYISWIGRELNKFEPLTPFSLTKNVKHCKLLLMDKFEFLTIEEVAKMLKLSTMTIYRYIESGKLAAYKLTGKAYRITPQDLKAFLKSKKTGIK